MFYCSCLRRSVIGFIVSHVVYNLPSVAAASVTLLLVLLSLLLGAVLAASSRMDQFLVEVVVVVFVEIGVGHDDKPLGDFG